MALAATGFISESNDLNMNKVSMSTSPKEIANAIDPPNMSSHLHRFL